MFGVMAAVGALFTGIGIYAWKRKKPMWFWSGSEVRKEEISDIPAYNRANGIMWIAFSAFFWFAALFTLLRIEAGFWISMAGWMAGIPCLTIVYKMIRKKYGKYR